MSISYSFWGSDEFSIKVLEELISANMKPAVIISVPDQPKGRKKIITPTILKSFARDRNIECLTPADLKDAEFTDIYSKYNLDVAVVASYGKIIPQGILDIPQHKTLNVHPSLLPLWRGSSPVQNTILHDDVAGVSIMLLDSKMDHGPILLQKEVILENPDTNPPSYESLRDQLATTGGQILAQAMLSWVGGNTTAETQDHSQATFTKMLRKSDGLIDISDNPFLNIRKIRAMNPWPGAFFILHKDNKEIRVKVLAAHIDGDKLIIERVVPEGKNEMDWESFEKGYLKN
jgi:methionyl-tRNA formyltransferase